MFDAEETRSATPTSVVIGAGMGGLATALRLRAAGHRVTLLDAHSWPGGKMRTVPSLAGPIDAGPTVLTMRHVFDDLFAATGSNLESHVALVSEPLLARHFWRDGSTLDLTTDDAANAEAIGNLAGPKASDQYRQFTREAKALFDLFREPVMEAADPSLAKLAHVSLTNPRHLPVLSPGATLTKLLRKRFSDPRLVQLFARYATYVGGRPEASPALLALIWHAEASGVWRVQGGMHRLAHALAERFQAVGGSLRLSCPVQTIDCENGSVTGVHLANGEHLAADQVVYAGDPRALADGRLGPKVTGVANQTLTTPRSLSARVWSFAAQPQTDINLAHHNVFFGQTPGAEFEDLAGGAMPFDPTIYLCAEDRGTGQPDPQGPERFEIILNAAPLTDAAPRPDEGQQCRQTTFQTLSTFGLEFDPPPPETALSTPTTFETLFPASAGALYGQSPHGMTAALKRPRTRTAIRGLYLAGGGTHPGAGVPMAALSGKHAAEAILTDHVST